MIIRPLSETLHHPSFSYALPRNLTVYVLYLLREVVACGKCFLLNKKCSLQLCCKLHVVMEDMLPQVVKNISHVNSAGMCATLEEFQMSGSVLNKIKIHMWSGSMQNQRTLVFHRISWGMKNVCLLHTIHCCGSQQNFQ